jgi:hypothetical protein
MPHASHAPMHLKKCKTNQKLRRNSASHPCIVEVFDRPSRYHLLLLASGAFRGLLRIGWNAVRLNLAQMRPPNHFLETYQQPASLSSSERPSPSHVASPFLTCCWISSAKATVISRLECRNDAQLSGKSCTYLVSHLLLISFTSLVSLIASGHLG